MAKLFSEVTIYPKEFSISDEQLGFVIIVSRHNGKRAFVQHKERTERELPGGHREVGESILEGAKRELFEETGAIDFDIEHIGYWSLVNSKGEKSFGAVFFAEVSKFGDIPESEIAKVDFFDAVPENTTYPNVHPLIYKMAVEYKKK